MVKGDHYSITAYKTSGDFEKSVERRFGKVFFVSGHIRK